MVYILLADGFEEAEALVPADLLRRAGVEVCLAGIGGTQITGAHGITVTADCALEALNADALIACRRAHPQGDLTVVALCPADRSAAAWAQRLSITLIDGKRLTQLVMAAHPVVPDSFQIQKKRRISLPTYGVFVEQINPVRSGFYAALTLTLYLARGGWPMLFSFVLLLAMTALGLRRRLSR